ncbi:MAG: hemerythrin family protein [Magnetococcales bacterium]|nr:hemerythrin family protein [Magnetococcales bacterium]MBF0151988.1 hemerythrin family protein [Magnetococcales bacterium]
MSLMNEVGKCSRSRILDRLEDVCVEELNRHHKEFQKFLLELNDLVDILSRKHPTAEEWAKVGSTMDFLGKYAKEHFFAEEVLMKKYSFPKLDAHKKEHGDFLNKHEEFCRKLIDNHDILYVVNVKFFLLEWFMHHVNHVDLEYGEYFKKCGYPCGT